jgi:hypothetical protein
MPHVSPLLRNLGVGASPSKRPNRSMKKAFLILALFLSACSPRDFLTRRLASDLISTSAALKAPQQYVLQTGVISNQTYLAPEYPVLQHQGWITATSTKCPPTLVPPPCWDVFLTPSGVDTIHTLVSTEDASKPSIRIPVARREFVAVTGISKQGNLADVDFTWKWVPLNEIGAALYSGQPRYKSTVDFREYDDGWRIAQTAFRPGQTIDDALKNAEPAP